MSEHIFDTLTRSTAAATSRRDYARALVGLALAGVWGSSLSLDDVEAKKKGRKRKKKRNRNKQSNQGNKSPLSCTPSCADKVCGDDGCGGSCGTCGPTQLCAQGQCVTGQGTCPPGADICNGFTTGCSTSDHECACWTTVSNQTRCGFLHPLVREGALCTNDNQCSVLFPEIPGVFCTKSTTGTCNPGGFCVAPCPNS